MSNEVKRYMATLTFPAPDMKVFPADAKAYTIEQRQVVLASDYDALRTQLEAIRAAGGEEVEVVAWMWRDLNGDVQFNYMHPEGQELMTVAQHQRIVAAMAAEVEQVREERDAIAGRLASTVHYIRRIDRRNDHPGRFDAEMNLLIREAIRQAEPVPPLAGQVSVPRELLERLLNALDKGFPCIQVAEELRALLATPSMEVKHDA